MGDKLGFTHNIKMDKVNNHAKRIEWVDIVKGLLILTVILGHAIQESLKVRFISFEDNLWRNIIYSFHMPAFMAMSGYVAQGKVFKSGLYKRFSSLMFPFFVWSIPLFLIYHNVDNILEYIVYPNKGYWFLWALFFIICIKTVGDWICLKTNIYEEVVSVIIALSLIGCQTLLNDPKLLGYEYVAYYYIFYIMGYYARKYSKYFSFNNFIAWTIFALWAAMALYWTPNGIPFFLEGITFVPTKILQLAYRMITPTVFIVWMYAVAPKIRISNNWIRNILIELGQVSLGLYVTHMVVKQLFAEALFKAAPLPIWSQVLIEFIILTLFSVAVVRYISRTKRPAKWMLGKS